MQNINKTFFSLQNKYVFLMARPLNGLATRGGTFLFWFSIEVCIPVTCIPYCVTFLYHSKAFYFTSIQVHFRTDMIDFLAKAFVYFVQV